MKIHYKKLAVLLICVGGFLDAYWPAADTSTADAPISSSLVQESEGVGSTIAAEVTARASLKSAAPDTQLIHTAFENPEPQETSQPAQNPYQQLAEQFESQTENENSDKRRESLRAYLDYVGTASDQQNAAASPTEEIAEAFNPYAALREKFED